jgi:high-affinity Fe2+/Pb2+ permease
MEANQQQTPPIQTPPPIPSSTPSNHTDTHTIITVILLIFAYPIGIIVMWFITKWPLWVKLLLTSFLLVFIAILGLLASVLVAVINPQEQLQRAQEAERKSLQVEQENQKMMEEIMTGTPTP